jgi:hypothetical protein
VEKSLNQPILPHAIVVLNAVDVGVGEDRWTVKDATASFLNDVSGILDSDPLLKELARNRGTETDPVRSAARLLQCYYKSVSVVRIPAKVLIATR